MDEMDQDHQERDQQADREQAIHDEVQQAEQARQQQAQAEHDRAQQQRAHQTAGRDGLDTAKVDRIRSMLARPGGQREAERFYGPGVTGTDEYRRAQAERSARQSYQARRLSDHRREETERLDAAEKAQQAAGKTVASEGRQHRDDPSQDRAGAESQSGLTPDQERQRQVARAAYAAAHRHDNSRSRGLSR